MLPTNLDPATISKIQHLIVENFKSRDELYAAAQCVDDESREHICRRLAEHLAANAIELQQLVAVSGVDPAEPLDVYAIAYALFDLAKANRGESGVFRAAAEGEQHLKAEYEQAVEAVNDAETKAILRNQAEDVDFGAEVLRNIVAPAPEQERGSEKRM